MLTRWLPRWLHELPLLWGRCGPTGPKSGRRRHVVLLAVHEMRAAIASDAVRLCTLRAGKLAKAEIVAIASDLAPQAACKETQRRVEGTATE